MAIKPSTIRERVLLLKYSFCFLKSYVNQR